MGEFLLDNIVDVRRYPIGRPKSAKYTAMLRRVRAMLAHDGCAVLPGFIGKDGIRTLADEADKVAPCAWRSFNKTNVYFTRDDESLPQAHPLRRFYTRTNAFVPADNFGEESPLRMLYEHSAFMPFIRDALAADAFYRYADPLADVIINVVEARQSETEGGFPWHFDTNSYTITLAIQNGDSGGVFQYSPGLRSAEDENYDGVQRVLDGDSRGVINLNLQPGDLQIFHGRHSLHRVTAVGGGRPRYVAIFSFTAVPGMVASVERCRQLYGRVLPVHLQKARARGDSLRD